MKSFRYLLLLIVLYIYFYDPEFVFIGFGLIKIVLIIALGYAVLSFGRVRRYLRFYKKEALISLFLICYLFIRVAIAKDNGMKEVWIMLKWLIESTIIPIFIIETLISKIKDIDVYDCCIKVGFIASLITLVLMAFPALNDVVRSMMLLHYDFLEDFFSFRSYGLASGLTGPYGIIQGILASMCLLRYDKKHWYYLVFFLTLTVSAAVNARTGLISILITLLYLVLGALKGFKVKNIIIIATSLAVFVVFANFLSRRYSEVFEWVSEAFFATADFITGNSDSDTAYFNVLDAYLQWPSTSTGVFFGEGRSLFGLDFGEGSDIGYVNQVFLGGILFAGGLLTIQYVFYKDLWKRSGKKFLPILLFLTALIINFKGVVFYNSNSFSRLVTLLFFCYVYESVRKMEPILWLEKEH